MEIHMSDITTFEDFQPPDIVTWKYSLVRDY